MKLFFSFFLTIFIFNNACSQILINEYSAANLNQYPDNHSDYEDWIELHNTGSVSVNLQGYYLSDDSLKPTKFKIRQVLNIPAGGYMRFWCSGRDTIEAAGNHTSFKLNQTKNGGEDIILSNPVGTIIDGINTQKHQLGHSVGRGTDGAAVWKIFKTPTINASNNTSYGYIRYAHRAINDSSAGFYKNQFYVTMTLNDTSAKIYYTINGFTPTASALLYTTPVFIDSTKVLKTVTICNDTNILPSFITFHTFFVNDTHTIPVVSVTGDSMFILLNNLKKAAVPYGSTEYFGVNRKRKATAYGAFNSHGQDSWVHNQRSFDIVCRDEMGYAAYINEQIFPQKTRDKFQRLVMRAAGDDNFSPPLYTGTNPKAAHIRDAYVQNLAIKGNLSLDSRTAAKCVAYVNGKYWGVYDLRELPDDHDFTDYYYGQGKYDIDYNLTWGNTWAEYGGQPSIDAWNAFKGWVLKANVADSNVYRKVTDSLDPQSLIDYIMVNTFTNCTDWINYNTGWWRGRNPNGTHKRWGYILWDNDAVFDFYINYTGLPNTKALAPPCQHFMISSTTDKNQHLELSYKLFENPEYRKLYKARYEYMAKNAFSCDTMTSELNKVRQMLTPEMPRHCARWAVSFPLWQRNCDTLQNFISSRCVFLADTSNYCDDDTIKKVVIFNKSYTTPTATRGYNWRVKGNIINGTVSDRKYWVNDSIYVSITKQNPLDSTKIFKEWRSQAPHILRPSSTSPNMDFIVKHKDTIDMFYVNYLTDKRTITFANPLIAKYKIKQNGVLQYSDTIVNVFKGETINLKLERFNNDKKKLKSWSSTQKYIPNSIIKDSSISYIMGDINDSISYSIENYFLLKFINSMPVKYDVLIKNNAIIDYSKQYIFGENDSIFFRIAKKDASPNVFKRWISKNHSIKNIDSDTSVYIIIMNDDTIDVNYNTIKTIRYKNSMPAKYAISENSHWIANYDSTYEYANNDSLSLKISKIDTSNYTFVKWKSKANTIKINAMDSLVYLFVLNNDTIEVEYIIANASITQNSKINIKVYPTEFFDNINIDYAGNTIETEIFLVDMTGQEIEKIRAPYLFNGTNNLKFNEMGLTEGYYYLLIKSKDGNVVTKMKFKRK